MSRIKRVVLLALSLLPALGLISCGASGPDMPMEFTVSGRTVVMGQTTTAEMSGWGWELAYMGSPGEILSNAEYASCDYHVRVDGGGSGREFWVSVYVPFQKNMEGDYVDLSAEVEESRTAGVVYRVNVRKSAGDKLNIIYNGMDLQDITWDTAAKWGAEVEEDGDRGKMAELDAAEGVLTFGKSYTSDRMNELTVTMSDSAFSELQKQQ